MAHYEIRLLKIPGDKIAFIRGLRLLGNLSLKQARDLALYLERFPKSVLVAGIERQVAEHHAAALSDAGLAVSVEASSLATPMMCAPAANSKFTWKSRGPFRHIAAAS